MTAEEMKAKSRWFIEEVNKGNIDALDEEFASNCVIHRASLPDIEGLTAFKQIITDLRTGMPDYRMTIDEIIIEGENKAVIRATQQGTNTGQSPLFPFPPTGKKAVWTICIVTHALEGKIVEQWEYEDIWGLVQQLGLIPPMG